MGVVDQSCRGTDQFVDAPDMRSLILLLTVLAANAQDKPRIGSDGRPLLNKPKLELCKKRKFHEKYGNHHYFLSWRESWNKFEDWGWFNGRNFCRERCMDLVSFEDPEEYRHFAKIIFKIRAATLTVCNQSTSTAGSGQMETKGFPPPIFLQERHFGQELEKKVNRSPTTGRESRKANYLMSGIKAG